MENEMPMTITRSKVKPKVEFQNGGRSLSKIGSSFNSAMDSDIDTKFGTLRHSNLMRTRALPNWNWKLIRDVNGRHIENFNDVITVPPMLRFT